MVLALNCLMVHLFTRSSTRSALVTWRHPGPFPFLISHFHPWMRWVYHVSWCSLALCFLLFLLVLFLLYGHVSPLLLHPPPQDCSCISHSQVQPMDIEERYEDTSHQFRVSSWHAVIISLEIKTLKTSQKYSLPSNLNTFSRRYQAGSTPFPSHYPLHS